MRVWWFDSCTLVVTPTPTPTHITSLSRDDKNEFETIYDTCLVDGYIVNDSNGMGYKRIIVQLWTNTSYEQCSIMETIY
jgi:hypothetical protein